VKSADDVVEYFLFEAHLVEEVVSFEAIFLVDEVPDIGAVVVCEGFDVRVDVEVLAAIVGFVFNMPDPPALAVAALVGPQITVVAVGDHFLGGRPEGRDVAIFAAAHRTTAASADALHDTQGAVLVDVQSDYPEVLCLHQPRQHFRCAAVHLLQGVLLHSRRPAQQLEAAEEEQEGHDDVQDIHARLTQIIINAVETISDGK
jgi:hypothetical protein